MLVGILIASGQIEADPSGVLYLGEISRRQPASTGTSAPVDAAVK
jgi:hypothetical protein